MFSGIERGAGACESFITNSTVSGNACVIGRGGGGYDSEFYGCSVFDNYSPTGAGMEKGYAQKCCFRNNATSGGATIFRSTRGFVDCDIQGAVFDWPGYLVNCRVHGYDMDGYATITEGANVYTSGVFKVKTISGTSPTMLYAVNNAGDTGMAATNTIFYNNRTTCLFWPASLHASFVNCQFVSNFWAKTCIGAGMDSGNSAEFVNSIFAGNCNTTRTAFVEWSPDSKGDTNIVMRYCLFGSGSRSNLPRLMENCRFDTEVKFKSDGENLYMPIRSQLVTRAGLVQDWMESATDIRGEGFPRLSDGRVDIGAYQYHRKVTGLEIFVK